MNNGYEYIERKLRENIKDLNGLYIVRIACRYSFEIQFDRFNTCVDFGYEGSIWMEDWWEGQDEIHLLGYLKVDDVKGLIYVK